MLAPPAQGTKLRNHDGNDLPRLPPAPAGGACASPRPAPGRPARRGAPAPATRTADRVVQSICPYCAVGCGQRVYVKDERVIQIEGDPDSPVSRGRLCPKGTASEQLVNGAHREYRVKYRRPHGTAWE